MGELATHVNIHLLLLSEAGLNLSVGRVGPEVRPLVRLLSRCGGAVVIIHSPQLYAHVRMSRHTRPLPAPGLHNLITASQDPA